MSALGDVGILARHKLGVIEFGPGSQAAGRGRESMRQTIKSNDPDIVGSFPALRRAALAARRLAKRTGTPLYVLEGGKIVNINPVRRRRANGRNHGKSG